MVPCGTGCTACPIFFLFARRTSGKVHRIAPAWSGRTDRRARQPGRTAREEPLLPIVDHDLFNLPRRSRPREGPSRVLGILFALPQTRNSPGAGTARRWPLCGLPYAETADPPHRVRLAWSQNKPRSTQSLDQDLFTEPKQLTKPLMLGGRLARVQAKSYVGSSASNVLHGSTASTPDFGADDRSLD